ncbi:MAG: DnaJ domain-containing protein [Desulfofustis sp.]|jgi:curved DNA-binding protein
MEGGIKDYYAILGVTPDSDEAQIRSQYRKLAMRCHPDRNPDDPQAEEKFKEIAEAYGVLTDPHKRSQYDAAKAAGMDWQHNGGPGGFSYSQEDILRDLFRDPRFQAMFQGLLQEFQRSGFRSSSRFVRQSFFGGKGLFIGGLFMLGSLAGPALMRSAGKGLEGGTSSSLLKNMGRTFGSLLGGAKEQEEPVPQAWESGADDLTYLMKLTRQELEHGKSVQVVTQGPEGQEMLRVRIPPGSKSGTKLRLRGRGATGPHGRGDLYLKLEQI